MCYVIVRVRLEIEKPCSHGVYCIIDTFLEVAELKENPELEKVYFLCVAWKYRHFVSSWIFRKIILKPLNKSSWNYLTATVSSILKWLRRQKLVILCFFFFKKMLQSDWSNVLVVREYHDEVMKYLRGLEQLDDKQNMFRLNTEQQDAQRFLFDVAHVGPNHLRHITLENMNIHQELFFFVVVVCFLGTISF